jgi:hypothetical protein
MVQKQLDYHYLVARRKCGSWKMTEMRSYIVPHISTIHPQYGRDITEKTIIGCGLYLKHYAQNIHIDTVRFINVRAQVL